ncbi:MAG: glycosyltransferase family 4 protein [Chloroflexota bacterium]
MRIALFHNLPSGGAKRTLYEQARRLAARHEIDVYTLSSADHAFADLRPFTSQHHSIPFAPLPLLRSPWGRVNQAFRLADLYRLRRPLRQIARQIETGGYDLLFVHPCRLEAASTLLHYVHGRLPTIYYCQEPLRRFYESDPPRPYDDDNFPRRRLLNRVDPLPPLYRSLLKGIDRRNVRRAGLVLVNSTFMQTAVRRIYQVEAEVSYHGVDVEWFRPLARPKKRMILSVGSLTPLKGFDFLIEAVGHMPPAERPPLVIASNFQNPPEREYLTQLAADLDVDLELRGSVSDEQLVQLYNETAVTAYTPIREPFGLVPLEAMACGSPVVAVREGGVQESVLHEETGLLVERDPLRFAQALRQILADESTAARYGENGRRHVTQHWTWDRAVETLADHLDSVSGRQ